MKKLLASAILLAVSASALAVTPVEQKKLICSEVAKKYKTVNLASCVKGKLNLEPSSDEVLDFSLIYFERGVAVECTGSMSEHNVWADLDYCGKVARD